MIDSIASAAPADKRDQALDRFMPCAEFRAALNACAAAYIDRRVLAERLRVGDVTGRWR